MRKQASGQGIMEINNGRVFARMKVGGAFKLFQFGEDDVPPKYKGIFSSELVETS
jgi:hypothetical protein